MDARARAWAAGALTGTLMAGWGGASPAQVPPPPTTFPTSLKGDALLGWLRRETDITPGQVVAVSPSAITAIVSSFPGGGGQGPRVVIRGEAVDRAAALRDGALSWHVSLNADCANRRVQLGETTGYAERNLLGPRQTLRPAEPEWRTPEPGTPMESAWRAACEPGFQRPLEAARSETAQAPIPTAPPDAPQYRAAPPAPAPAAEPTAAPQASEPERQPRGARVRASTVSVQVMASASEAEARAALARLGPRLDGRETRVETAQVQGRTWWRALVTGFADRGEAARFCEALKADGQACFVRPGG